MLIALAVEPSSTTLRQFETLRATNEGWLCAPGGNDNPDAEFECIFAIGRLASRLAELDASLLRSVGWATPTGDFTISNGGELVLEAVTNRVVVPESMNVSNPPVATLPIFPEGSEVSSGNLVLPLTSCSDNKIQFSTTLPANDPTFNEGDRIPLKSLESTNPISNLGGLTTDFNIPNATPNFTFPLEAFIGAEEVIAIN